MVVFVHGVPETHHLWNGVREALGRNDTIAVACPGFGTPRPAGFAATKEAYVDWLVAELEKIGEPVDLVGHDWGGAFTLRIASIRPDLFALVGERRRRPRRRQLRVARVRQDLADTRSR